MGFQLKGGIREGESPAHVAVREAFVNALVHADYAIPTSVLVVKRADLFSFKNPGDMRVPLEIAMAGGESDSRNKSIQDMFRMIGAGERQGHGIRKILEGWKRFDWRIPNFEVKKEPTPRVVVTLSMLSLFPESAVQILSSYYEKRWEHLDEVEKIALILALTEGAVTHSRLSQFCTKHPRDVSDTLLNLDKTGALETTGQYRSKTYHIPGHMLPTSEDVFESSSNNEPRSPNNEPRSPNNEPSYPNNEPSSPNNEPSYPNNEPSSPNLDEFGRILHPEFQNPFIDDLSNLDPQFRKRLEAIAERPRAKKRINPEKMKGIILALCTKQYVTTGALSALLRRNAETLRGQYLSKLKNEGKLRMAFPRSPTDPKQAYIAI